MAVQPVYRDDLTSFLNAPDKLTHALLWRFVYGRKLTHRIPVALIIAPSLQMSCILSCCLSHLKDLVLYFERFQNFKTHTTPTMASRQDKTKRETNAPPPDSSAARSSSAGVCKPGKQTRNPYLNFLRDFRRKNCHLPVVEVVRQGAAQWRHMTDEQKLPYVKIAFYTPLKRRRCPVCPTMPGRRMGQVAMKQRRRRRRRSNAHRMPKSGRNQVKQEKPSSG
uniref:HMG box domain-containing protein n=2 Tax=Anopheles gambiae TaxID=7165 RepID=A0A1S4HEU6_ANOGA